MVQAVTGWILWSLFPDLSTYLLMTVTLYPYHVHSLIPISFFENHTSPLGSDQLRCEHIYTNSLYLQTKNKKVKKIIIIRYFQVVEDRKKIENRNCGLIPRLIQVNHGFKILTLTWFFIKNKLLKTSSKIFHKYILKYSSLSMF